MDYDKKAIFVSFVLSCLIMLLILLVIGTGCISPLYHQRKLREARGEEAYTPPTSETVNQEYLDFMNHKRDTEE